MTDYTKTTNFAAKDSLPSGNANKIVKGAEIDTEFTNIATASATKANIASPTFTGTVTIPTADINGGAVDATTIGASSASSIVGTTIVANTSINIAGDGATVTGIKDEDDMSSNSATKLATQQSIKAYVDSQVTAQDLDVTDGSSSIDIDLDSESLGILGGTGLSSTASGTSVTLAIDSTVATLTGSQTLTNKTLTAPTLTGTAVVASLDISGDVDVDGTLETDALSINGTTVTSTAAELNILDGVTSTAAELNILDGVTSTTAELNILDGVTSTAAELNILDGKAFLDEDDMSSNSATGIASQQSIKAYVDAQITAEDLDFQADSGGALSIDLDSETLTFTGGTGIDTSGSGNAVTFAIDSTVATLTGSQTLTNKTLTSPDINTPDIDGGTIDNTVIGGSTAAAGTFTTFTSNGIDDNADATAITIDSSENVGIGLTSNMSSKLHVNSEMSFGPDGDNRAILGYASDAFTIGTRQSATNYFSTMTVTGGNVGIGTSAMSSYYAKNLVVMADGDNTGGITIAAPATDDTTYLTFADGTSGAAAYAGYVGYAHNGDDLLLGAGGETRVTIDSTGIDVTGSVTASTSLAVSSGVPFIDWIDTATTDKDTRAITYNGDFYIGTINDAKTTTKKRFLIQHSTGDIHLGYEDTGTTPKLFWDASAESLGIGTSSLASGDKLTVAGRTKINSLYLGEVSSNYDLIQSTSSAGLRLLSTGGSVYLDSSGNVGIGTSSPRSVSNYGVLAVNGSSGSVIDFELGESLKTTLTQSSGQFEINVVPALPLVFKTSNSEAMRIDHIANITQTFSDGSNVTAGNMPSVTGYTLTNTINSNGSGAKLEFSLNNGSAKAAIAAEQSAATSSSLNFYTENSGTFAEAMRIDSSGRVLIGQTSAVGIGGTPADINGTEIGPGYINLNRDDTASNKVLQFGGNGVLNGFIATLTSAGIVIAAPSNNGAGLAFNDNANIVYPTQTQSGVAAVTDNAIDLGTGGVRFQDIFATNGTIQTSDRNEKQDIEALSDAEQRVAVAAKGLLRKFRWKSAVEEKGDDARIHFGIIAQDLQDAFTAEGLDAGRYAMFISSTWTDEETGEERTRLGVRYSELLAFIISAI